jgi:hypothetical protein
LSSILNKLWRDQYLHLQCFVLLSCCSIFNDRATRSCGQLDYYITLISLCQYLFQNFSKKFLRFFQSSISSIYLSRAPPFRESLSIILLMDLFVNRFLKI